MWWCFLRLHGIVLGAFGLSLGINTAYFAEIMAATLATEFAHDKGWYCLWLESDSMLVIHLFSNPSLNPPWGIHNRWLNCCNLINSMAFRFSHIFWETNYVADHLTNLGLICDSLTWWQTPPLEILELLSHDANEFLKYHFIWLPLLV